MVKQGSIFLLKVELFPPPVIPTVNFFPLFCHKLAIYATKHNYFTTFQVIPRHLHHRPYLLSLIYSYLSIFVTFFPLLPIIL